MRVLFWLYLLTIGGGMIYLAIPREGLAYSLHVWAGFAALSVGLVGFYGVAYGKRIGSRYFWWAVLAADAVLFLLSFQFVAKAVSETIGLGTNTHHFESDTAQWLVLGSLGLLMLWAFAVPLVALFLYAFRRPSIWHPSALNQK